MDAMDHYSSWILDPLDPNAKKLQNSSEFYERRWRLQLLLRGGDPFMARIRWSKNSSWKWIMVLEAVYGPRKRKEGKSSVSVILLVWPVFWNYSLSVSPIDWITHPLPFSWLWCKQPHCLNRWLSGSSLKKVALSGCPCTERKTVFAAKRLRSFFCIQEDVVIPALPSEAIILPIYIYIVWIIYNL